MAELREAVSEDRQREFGDLTRMRLKRNLLDELSAQHDFDIPQGMVDDEYNSIWAQYEQQRDAEELDDEDKDKSEDEHKADFREIAERRVSLGLLLSEVGRVNNIQVGQDEINQRLFQEAQKYPGQEQQVLEFYRGNPQAMESVSAPVYEDKVIDFILELAQLEPRTVTMEELLKEPDEPKKPTKKKAAKKPAKKVAATADDAEKPAKKKPAAKKKAAKSDKA